MDRVRGGIVVGELNPDIEQVVLTEDEIQSKVALMGKQISEDYRDDDLLLVGVLKGAFVMMDGPYTKCFVSVNENLRRSEAHRQKHSDSSQTD